MFVYINHFNSKHQELLEAHGGDVVVLNPEEMPGIAVFVGPEKAMREMITKVYSTSGLPLHEATEDGTKCWPDRDFARKVLGLVEEYCLRMKIPMSLV